MAAPPSGACRFKKSPGLCDDASPPGTVPSYALPSASKSVAPWRSASASAPSVRSQKPVAVICRKRGEKTRPAPFSAEASCGNRPSPTMKSASGSWAGAFQPAGE